MFYLDLGGQFLTGIPQLPSIELNAPLDGSILEHTSPTFSWSALRDGVSYSLRYGSDPLLVGATEIAGLIEPTWTSSAPFPDHSTFYWQVMGFGLSSTSTSPIWCFGLNTVDQPPPAPSLLTPGDRTTPTTVPDLTWNEVFDPGDFIQYRAQLSLDPSFSSLLATSPTLTAPSWFLAETVSLPSRVPIWWRTQAIDISGDTGTSTAWSFVVDYLAPPSGFTLHLTNRNFGREDWFETFRQPTLSWEPSTTSSGAITYLLRYSTSPSLNEVLPIVITATSYAIPEPLLDHSKYYWDVWAEDERGQITKSSGQQYLFITNDQNEPPSTPANPSPVDGAEITQQHPILNWNCLDPDPYDWVFYEVFSSFDSTFTNTLFSTWTATAPYTLEDYIPPGSPLYWKVRAFDLRDGPMGGESWSPTWSLNNSIPSLPAMSFPYFSDLEETDSGWSSWGRNSDWQWGAPSAAAGVPPTGHSGNKCWGNNLRGNYYDDQNGYLMARFTGTTSPCVLSYWQWFNLENGWDYGYLEISHDARDWTVLGTPITGVSSGWQREIVELSLYVNPGEGLYLRFRLASDQLYSLPGWFLDDISLTPAAVGTVILNPTSATTTVGQQCAFTATVLDPSNNPVPGCPVSFIITGTHTSSAVVLTGPDGTVNWSYIQTTPGTDSIACSAWGIVGETAQSEWILGPYRQVSLTPTSGNAVAGSDIPFVASLVDDYGNTISTGGIAVTFTVSGAHSASETTLTDPTGTATWSYLETSPGIDSIVASTSIATSPTSTLQWLPAPAATVTLSPSASSLAVRSTHTLTALVLDMFGNPIPDTGVTFTVTGAHQRTSTSTTSQGGVATWSYSEDTNGVDWITASTGGVQSNPARQEWNANPVATINLSPIGAEKVVGHSHQLQGQALDQNGSPISGITLRFNTAGAHNIEGMAVTDFNGMAAWSYTATTPGIDSIAASIDLVTSNTASVQWLVGPVNSISLSPSNSSQSVSTTHTLTALVTDLFNNPISGIPITFTVTGVHPQISGLQWTPSHTSSAPMAQQLMSMVYDATNHKFILFGSGETWLYDDQASTWRNLLPVDGPSKRDQQAMIWEDTQAKAILFGGFANAFALKDTWAYDSASNTWVNRSPVDSPPTLRRHAMVYDPIHQKVILFGGYNGTRYLNETWSYDYATNQWTNLNPSNPPPARGCHGMSYDQAHERVLLFGGWDQVGPTVRGDTWAYDYDANAWTNLNPCNSPSPRLEVSMEYVSSIQKILLFGGTWAWENRNNELWSYDWEANRWDLLPLTDRPSARSAQVMAFDSYNNQMILFGGNDGTRDLNDTWILSSTSSTNQDGVATWSYAEETNGVDWITASTGGVQSNPARQEWMQPCVFHAAFSVQGASLSSQVKLSLQFQFLGEKPTQYTYTVTTLANNGLAQVNDLVPGTYDVLIKEEHSLSVLRTGIVLSSGVTTTVDFGELRMGDANVDDLVNIVDFAILKGAIFTWEGQPGFDPRADFNGDEIINIMDFALIKSNFGKWGPT